MTESIERIFTQDIPYEVYALLAVCIFALVHLYAGVIRRANYLSTGFFLSACGGVAIAYVFVDLLPKLCKSDILVTKSLADFFPYLERHVFIMSLLGFLLFFAEDKNYNGDERNYSFILTISSYALFNYLVGYAVVDQNNPEVRPLVLFTFAMALHYFTNDYTLSKEHSTDYRNYGKWILVLALFLGWMTGVFFMLSETAVALVSAFIGGGVIMNVIRHELPNDKPNSLNSFLFFCALYTIVLLAIG
jgi:hypothetical protein